MRVKNNAFVFNFHPRSEDELLHKPKTMKMMAVTCFLSTRCNNKDENKMVAHESTKYSCMADMNYEETCL